MQNDDNSQANTQTPNDSEREKEEIFRCEISFEYAAILKKPKSDEKAHPLLELTLRGPAGLGLIYRHDVNESEDYFERKGTESAAYFMQHGVRMMVEAARQIFIESTWEMGLREMSDEWYAEHPEFSLREALSHYTDRGTQVKELKEQWAKALGKHAEKSAKCRYGIQKGGAPATISGYILRSYYYDLFYPAIRDLHAAVHRSQQQSAEAKKQGILAHWPTTRYGALPEFALSALLALADPLLRRGATPVSEIAVELAARWILWGSLERESGLTSKRLLNMIAVANKKKRDHQAEMQRMIELAQDEPTPGQNDEIGRE